MCWKWIKELFKPDPMEHHQKLLLSFACNNYPGKANDLNGCINDQKNIVDNLYEFHAMTFSNSEVTKRTFIDEIEKALGMAEAGDVIVIHYSGHGSFGLDPTKTEADGYSECLYLYDGPFWDREFMEILALIPDGVKVVVILDSCFSFGATTRKLRNPYNKPRFIQFQDINPEIPIKRNVLHRSSLKHVLLAGCGERQTSADAYINGSYNGAFTWFAMATLNRGFTYKEWHAEIRKYLPSDDFNQKPELEGPEELLTKQILV